MPWHVDPGTEDSHREKDINLGTAGYFRMIPIHQLLNRIRWDAEFGKGSFQLGYYDRAENQIILVPFEEVAFPPESPETFQLTDSEGQVHRVPFHRVREVYKNSQRIWHRGPSRD